jgi:hypothetical protein
MVAQSSTWQLRMLRETQKTSPQMSRLTFLKFFIYFPIVLHAEKDGAVYLLPEIMALHLTQRETLILSVHVPGHP